MNLKIKQKPFAFAVIFWLAIIFIAHFFAPPGYIWTQNTISELASQGHVYKWIMQVGMMGFGLLVVLSVGLTGHRIKTMFLPLLPIAAYGFGVFLSGIFCAAPIDPTIPYSNSEAQLHSTFASLAGFSLSLGIIWQFLISSTRNEKMVHFIILVLVIGFSALFGLAENNTIAIGIGIIQRLLYLSGFAWLIYQEWMLARVNKAKTEFVS